MDIGLVNYRSNGGELKSGVYTLRIIATGEIRERGRHPAVAEFIDEKGPSAFRQRLDLEVFSTEVPPNGTHGIIILV